MEALVVFSDENEHWLGRTLTPAYRHVYCVIPTADGCSTEINLTTKGIMAKTFAGDPKFLMPDYQELDDTSRVMLVKYDAAQRHLLPYSVNNCVGLTKQILGLTSWAITPHQLFKHLQAKGDPMRINLTFAGFGGGSSGKAAAPLAAAPTPVAATPLPTPPTATPAPATAAEATQAQAATRTGAENIRNMGGGRGLDVKGTTSRALKSLMGQ